MYGGALTILLTQSRAGVVGAVAVVVLWLVLSRERLVDAVRLVVFAGPGLAVGAWAFTRPALVDDGVLRADRVSDGRIFAVLTLLVALGVAVAAWKLPIRRLVGERERLVRTVLIVSCAVVLVGGAVGLVAKVGDPFSWASSQFSGGECANAPGRLADLCANNRIAWWKESLHIARDRPLGGSGAGTYAIARLRYRIDATQASEPHSVPLQLLADLGVVGLVLGLTVVGGAIVAARGGMRLVYGDDGGAAAALACLLVAYETHALVDYDLDFLAVTAPTLLALSARCSHSAAGAPRRVRGARSWSRSEPRRRPPSLAVALPALADDEVQRSLDAADAGRIADAVDAATARAASTRSRSARSRRARVAADAPGDERAAVAWYERGDPPPAREPGPLVRPRALPRDRDPRSLCRVSGAQPVVHARSRSAPAGSPGGPLDVARDAVNAGACGLRLAALRRGSGRPARRGAAPAGSRRAG